MGEEEGPATASQRQAPGPRLRAPGPRCRRRETLPQTIGARAVALVAELPDAPPRAHHRRLVLFSRPVTAPLCEAGPRGRRRGRGGRPPRTDHCVGGRPRAAEHQCPGSPAPPVLGAPPPEFFAAMFRAAAARMDVCSAAASSSTRKAPAPLLVPGVGTAVLRQTGVPPPKFWLDGAVIGSSHKGWVRYMM